jgi:phospholipid/cholesterol/gamma-HCH transport system substrate-binding protein
VTRSLLVRLVALAVVTAVGVYYIAFDAIGVHLWDGPYTVNVDLPATEVIDGMTVPAGAGGLYQDAYVTYRGVEVGKVAALHLHPDMVVAQLAISRGVRIPADVTANVKELTAAAEQYLDLEPPAGGGGGGYLSPGSTIPADRTAVPVSIGTLLNSLNSLVDSLSVSDLNTLTASLATGLQNAGGNLRQIIDDSNTLVEALQQASTGTAQLINAGQTVLSTFDATSSDFEQFSASLDQLSAQLAENDATLRGLLDQGATAGPALNQFLDAYGSPTVGLVDNLAASTGVAYQRQDAIRALFQVLPLFATDVAATVQGGQINFQVDFNTESPVCSYTPMLPEPTTANPGPANLSGNCPTVGPGLLQRGAATAPPPHT